MNCGFFTKQTFLLLAAVLFLLFRAAVAVWLLSEDCFDYCVFVLSEQAKIEARPGRTAFG